MRDNEHQADVIVAVDDLFFSTRIETVARQAGVTIARAENAEELERQLAAVTPRLVILDLDSRRCAPIEAIRRIKADSRFLGSRVVGFLSHVHVDREHEAVVAGCDQVLPRSLFTARLPQILLGNDG